MSSSVSQAEPARNVAYPDILSFFDALYQMFEQANQATEPVERWYNIADHVVRLRFAGPALVSAIAPAFDHLQCAAHAALDMTVCMWDSASTGVSPPQLPWGTQQFAAPEEVQVYQNERIVLAFNTLSGTLSLFDRKRRVALFWVNHTQRLQEWERASPLLLLMHWWMREHQCYIVHSAAVGTEHGGVLITGKGGAGKSTTALSCLHSSLSYAGDDHILVQIRPEHPPVIHSLYNSAKLHAHHVHNLPHVVPHICNREHLEQEKALMMLYSAFPNKICRGFSLRAILTPSITGRAETRLRKASAITILKALAPSTIFQLPTQGEQDFRQFSTLVRQVPGYILDVGTDLARIPDTIMRLLAGDNTDVI